MRPAAFLLIACLPSCALAASAVGPPTLERGTVRFSPIGDQKDTPARYRLKEGSYDYEMQKKRDLSAIGVTIHDLRFPSPVKSATPQNNTVYAEYYRPNGKGPF